MSRRDQPPHVLRRRAVLNMHWPRKPASFKDHDPIPVTVRVVWAQDGEEYLPGEAVRWDADHVYVRIDDARCGGNGVWVKPADVYRSLPE
jgi:hypothetical protein